MSESCFKLVKFMIFTQKIQKKINFVKSEKFHLELAQGRSSVKLFSSMNLSMIVKTPEIREGFVTH